MRRGRAGEASVGARRNSHLAKAENIHSAFATALSLRHDPARRERGEHEADCTEYDSAGTRTTDAAGTVPSPHVWTGRASLQKRRSALASCRASWLHSRSFHAASVRPVSTG